MIAKRIYNIIDKKATLRLALSRMNSPLLQNLTREPACRLHYALPAQPSISAQGYWLEKQS